MNWVDASTKLCTQNSQRGCSDHFNDDDDAENVMISLIMIMTNLWMTKMSALDALFWSYTLYS